METMMLDKSKFEWFFLFGLKMGHKAVETTHNISNTLGPGTANKCTYKCGSGSRSLVKATRALKMSGVAGRRKSATTNWEPSSKLIPLRPHESCSRTQRRPLYGRSAREANWKGEKARSLVSWPQSTETDVLQHRLLSFYATTVGHFLDRIVMCDKKQILYDSWQRPAQRLDQEKAPKHFPKPNLHQEWVTVTV